jgi:hypothetical protein
VSANFLVLSLSRRTWLQRIGAGVAALLPTPPLLAQEQPLDATIRSMATVTGVDLSDSWLQPTAGLVGIIVADSKPLRALDLGSIEPATHFKAD